jgi:ribonuclease HI
MVPLHRQASALRSRLGEVSLEHVRREKNRDADRLANKALDTKDSKLD